MRKPGVLKPRVLAWLLLPALVIAAAGTSLMMQQVSRHALQAEALLVEVICEVQYQDGQKWRAISGRASDTVRDDLQASRTRVEGLLVEAGGLGVPDGVVDRVRAEHRDLAAAVTHELDLLDDGRQQAAEAWDRTVVDPAAEALLADLMVAMSDLADREQVQSRLGSTGLVLGVALSLALAVLLHRRLHHQQVRESAERSAEARYRCIIEESADLILVVGRDGVVSFLSPAAGRALQETTGSEWQPGRDLGTAVRPEDRAALRTLLDGSDTMADLRLGSGVYEFSARDLSTDPMVGGVVMTGRDVTAARALDDAKAELVSTVSHELRTPLATINGRLEMLRDGDHGPIPAEMDAPLTAMERSTDRLLKTVRELVFLAGADARPAPTSSEPLDFGRLVRDTAGELRLVAGEHPILIDVEDGGDALRVRGNGSDLERVVSNLVENALKFSLGTDAVLVDVATDGDDVVLDVVDRGIGIPEDEVPRLFTRFFRSSLAHEHHIPGTGLGLAVCRSVVEAHGGTIEVTSRPGEGTTMTVRLPRHAGAPDDGHRRGPQNQEPRPPIQSPTRSGYDALDRSPR